MKRFTPLALLALLIVPAVSYAATEQFKGSSDDDDNVKVKFELKDEGKDDTEIKSFKAKEVEFSCDERDEFRANPPEFTNVEVDEDGEIDEDYSFTERDRDEDGDKVEIKFKAKLEGKLKGDKKGYEKGDGEMSFDARYKSDGDRCESEELEWNAKLKDDKKDKDKDKDKNKD